MLNQMLQNQQLQSLVQQQLAYQQQQQQQQQNVSYIQLREGQTMYSTIKVICYEISPLTLSFILWITLAVNSLSFPLNETHNNTQNLDFVFVFTTAFCFSILVYLFYIAAFLFLQVFSQWKVFEA